MYTGNTCLTSIDSYTLTVYPCVYREHPAEATVSMNVNGLSLCIQGTLFKLKVCCLYFQVYPCVYREHSMTNLIDGKSTGLSLCIQGTLKPNQTIGEGCRFIPVYTGNTFGRITTNKIGAVYPCVYREHVAIFT